MNKTLGVVAIISSLAAPIAQAEGTNLIGITQNPENVYYLDKPSASEMSAAILSGRQCDFQAIRDTQGNIIGVVPNDIQAAVDQAQKEIVWICEEK